MKSLATDPYGAFPIQLDCDREFSSQWNFELIPNSDLYRIRLEGTGDCLDTVNDISQISSLQPFYTPDQVRVTLCSPSNRVDQLFRIRFEKQYRLIVSAQSERCLTFFRESPRDGERLVEMPCGNLNSNAGSGNQPYHSLRSISQMWKWIY